MFIKSLIRKFKYKLKYKGTSISRFANVSVLSIQSDGNTYIKESVTLVGQKVSFKGENHILERSVIDAKNISFGLNTSLQIGSYLFGEVHLGNDVIIGPHFYASSYYHDFKTNPWVPIRVQDLKNHQQNKVSSQAITIEDDSWIGMNCFVAPGITIAKGTVVGFGSMVNKQFPPYSIIAGSPAKIIGTRLEYRPPDKISHLSILDYPYFYSGFSVQDDKIVTVDEKISIHLNYSAGTVLSLKFSVPSDASVKIGHLQFSISATQSALEIPMSEFAEIDLQRPLKIEIFDCNDKVGLLDAWIK